MSSNSESTGSNKELTAKDIILNIQKFWKEIWKYKGYIILVALIFGILMAVSALRKKPTFNADLTFMLNNDESGGGIGGIGAILGSFGLNSGTGSTNLEKILSLSKSRNIAKEAFFKEIEIGGKEDYLANHVIEYKDSLGQWATKPFYKFWKPTPKLKGFKFNQDSLASFSRLENSALKQVKNIVLGGPKSDGLVKTNFNENTRIMKISCNSLHPDISMHLTNEIFAALSSYYIEKTIEKQSNVYELVKSKTDSIELELRSNEYALATLKDTKQSIFRNKDKLNELRLEGKIRMGYAALAKAKENLEIADFSLKNKTPFIQLIDEPLYPLVPEVPSFVRSGIIGGFLGAFIMITLIIGRFLYREIMA